MDRQMYAQHAATPVVGKGEWLISSHLHPETIRSEGFLWRWRAPCSAHIIEYDYCLIVFRKFARVQFIISREPA